MTLLKVHCLRTQADSYCFIALDLTFPLFYYERAKHVYSTESEWWSFSSSKIGKVHHLLFELNRFSRYSLLITFCSLLVTFSLPLVSFCSLLVTFGSLPLCFLVFAHCLLRFARYSLLFNHCSLAFACCSLLFAPCALLFGRC